MEDTWPTTPLPPAHISSSPAYGDFEIAAQPASDAASSTTTVTVPGSDISAQNSSAEISSTPQTTPEVDDLEKYSSRDASATDTRADEKDSDATTSAQRRREADLLFHRAGITFTLYGDEQDTGAMRCLAKTSGNRRIIILRSSSM